MQAKAGSGSQRYAAYNVRKGAFAKTKAVVINMKKRLIRLAASGVLFAGGIIINNLNIGQWWLTLAVFIGAYLIIGADVVIEAVRNIFHGHVFDENFLMSVATIGAFAIGEYPEAVAVMLFYQVGEMFQDYAVNKSRKSISELMNIRPDYANVIRNGETLTVDPGDIAVGEEIAVKAGEKIPLDGEIISGSSSIDTSALTGESMPRDVEAGDKVLSGCINTTGFLTVRVEKEFGESTVSKILDLVENASSKKSNSENFITRFAAVYTPIVVVCAVLLAVIPPLVIPGQVFGDWIYRALSFLVVSCPCALVISIPLSFFGGIGGASRAGILVKGSNYLEALAKAETVVFDKTGTLTKGVFQVKKTEAVGMSEEALLEYAALAESYSNHPISLSLKKAYGKDIDENLVTGVQELSGKGVSALVKGKRVLAGNGRLMDSGGIKYRREPMAGTVVHVAVEDQYAGYILIADTLKEDSKEAVSRLNASGIRTVMLTGDAKMVGESVAKELGIGSVYAELMPGDKVEKVEELLNGKTAKGVLAFVGDGINDAPVLARADIGIAMGGLGSDAAIEAADVVIMNDEPSKIVTAMKISRKTLGIAKQNIIFAFAVKVLVLVLVAFGASTMWEAVFADVGVAVIAILNAMRVMRTKKF